MASLGSNIIWNYIGRSWSSLLGIILIPIYIQFIGIEAYGLVGFYMSLAAVFGILDLGIGETVKRELARLSVQSDATYNQRDLVRTLETIYWGVSIIAGLTVYFSANYIATKWITFHDLNHLQVVNTIKLMGISLGLQFPISLYQGGLMGLQKQVLVNKILLLTTTLRSLGVLLVLWLISSDIETFFIWQLLTSSISCMIFVFAMWYSLPKSETSAKFQPTIIKNLWRYALTVSGTALIGISLTQLDKVILSNLLSLKMFAYYSIASTAASSIWLVIIPFSSAIFPYLVQLYERKKHKQLSFQFHQFSQILSLLLLPVSAIIIVFSKEILTLWIKDPIVVENSYLVMSFLVFGTMLNGIVCVPANSASAFGWPQLILYTGIVQAIAFIPLIILFVNWFQSVGAAVAWVLLNASFIFFTVPMFFRKYFSNEKRSWYVYDILLPMIAAFSICICSVNFIPQPTSTVGILIKIVYTAFASILVTGLSLGYIRRLTRQWYKSHLLPHMN